MNLSPKIKPLFALTIGLFVVLVGSLAYLGYRYLHLTRALTEATQEIALRTDAISALENTLQNAEEDKKNLNDALVRETQKMTAFEEQIKSITGAIGTLDKLAKTDPELLQKYSRVYFLSENYIPESLSTISTEYTTNKEKQLQIHTKVLPYLTALLSTAKQAGTPIEIISAYRSFGEQSTLKATYKVTYGIGVSNQFSADQGYSEHQLGTTIDITTPTIGTAFITFGKTDAYTWMLANAYKYGFVLSYPEENFYYEFEPWHWRFVGVKLATDLHNTNKDFYDLNQRDIDPYLVDIFDTPPLP